MTDKSRWKNKNRNILKNLPSWDKDANVIPKLPSWDKDANVIPERKTKAKGKK